MRQRTFGSLLVLASLTLPVFAGCAETISEQKTTKVKADGTTTTDRDTVKRMPDGTVVHEKEMNKDAR